MLPDDIREYVEQYLTRFMFEPNDDLTRETVKNGLDLFLGERVVNGDFFDFACICDLTNNTPEMIRRSEFNVDIAIKQDSDSNFVYFPVKIHPIRSYKPHP